MRTTRLGSLEISVVGLGCNNFGRGLDQSGSAVVVDAALESGINFFDTSSNYGGGESEVVLSRALGERRAEVVVATKFGIPVAGMNDGGGARPEYIERMIERSLRQLDTDYIDLYQLHKPDPATPIEATLQVLTRLVEEGKVREIGCSNLGAEQLSEALAASDRLGFPRFVANQIEYSMLHREPEDDGTAAICRSENVAILPYYPLANGMLTGKVLRGEAPRGRLKMVRYQSFLSDQNFDIVDRLRAFSDDRAIQPVHAAISWLLSRPQVPSVTAGAMTPHQVRSNALASQWHPSDEDLLALEHLMERSRP